MEIFAAYDLTGSVRSAAVLVGGSHHTVAAHVAARGAGRPVGDLTRRPQVTDPFLDKMEEWVKASKGRIRADKGAPPWVTEPGMWLQYDFGDGPVVDGVKTVLFVAWLAWSMFRVLIAFAGRDPAGRFASGRAREPLRATR
jgi:hypothetical protein